VDFFVSSRFVNGIHGAFTFFIVLREQIVAFKVYSKAIHPAFTWRRFNPVTSTQSS
jgi:hypothetical protein